MKQLFSYCTFIFLPLVAATQQDLRNPGYDNKEKVAVGSYSGDSYSEMVKATAILYKDSMYKGV